MPDARPARWRAMANDSVTRFAIPNPPASRAPARVAFCPSLVRDITTHPTFFDACSNSRSTLLPTLQTLDAAQEASSTTATADSAATSIVELITAISTGDPVIGHTPLQT